MHSDVCFKNLRHRESWKLREIIALLSLRHSKMTVGHLIKSAFFRHLNARFSSNFPPGEYQVISTLPKMSQIP